MLSKGRLTTGLVVGCAAVLLAGSPSSSKAAKTEGSVVIVQAVPDAEMSVTVDGEPVQRALAKGAVVRLALEEGEHEFEFDFEGGSVAASVPIEAAKTSDVVVHRPSEVDGEPVVSVFPTPVSPIGPGKARVLLAHTATTAPADVEVDGQVVFTNIANGEYAEADLPAGEHRVALIPSGVTGPPILGPLDVTLEKGILTSVYAVGNPRSRSMDVIVLETPLAGDGSEPPTQVDTGSAGLVAALRLLTFAADD